MLTGFIGRLALLLPASTAHHRAHPRPGRQYIASNHVSLRKLLGTGSQQVVEFLAADARALVQIFLMVKVCGAHHRGAFPREDKHRPAIAGVQKSDRLSDR
ncbi:hypothetical protein D3C75_904030 [compost metagenome]